MPTEEEIAAAYRAIADLEGCHDDPCEWCHGSAVAALAAAEAVRAEAQRTGRTNSYRLVTWPGYPATPGQAAAQAEADARHAYARQQACGCWRCLGERNDTVGMSRFVVCPTCGNKRCPHANNHRYRCTNSNEPGQIGSAYVDANGDPSPQPDTTQLGKPVRAFPDTFSAEELVLAAIPPRPQPSQVAPPAMCQAGCQCYDCRKYRDSFDRLAALDGDRLLHAADTLGATNGPQTADTQPPRQDHHWSGTPGDGLEMQPWQRTRDQSS